MRQVLCSRLVGREEEMALLAEDLATAGVGQGHAIFLLGEAGVGKSRITREVEALARGESIQVLRGRAVEGSTSPYRPIAEALHSGIRTSGPPDVPALKAYRSILSRLIPEWRGEDAPAATVGSDAADDPSLLLGEAILRLLRVLGSGSACLFVLEDLHWADVDSLAVVEYLIDNLATEPVLLLGTLRSEEPSAARSQARRTAARRAGRIIELPRLDRESVERMAQLCLSEAGGPAEQREATDAYPEPVVDFLASYSEGLPFLIEELLAAWIDVGALAYEAGRWEAASELPPIAPLTFGDTVNRRLAALDGETCRLLELAAILGRHFDWTLLPQATGVSEQVVLERLGAAIGAQLVGVDHAVADSPDRVAFAFRHALTRAAILDRLLPPQRALLSLQMLAVIERIHPELPGAWCDLAAALAEPAGRMGQAAELLLRSGRRAVVDGALATAESILDRALRLAAEDSALGIEIAEVLLEALALAGKWERVFAVGEDVLQVLEREPGQEERTAGIYLRMARAALAAARWDDAPRYLDAAGRQIGRQSDLLARLDALRAHLAIERSRLDEAASFAQSALEGAERTGQPEVACEALEVLGRCARVNDLDRAEAAFERAREIADENGLGVWRIRALHELGTLDIFRGARLERLLEARELAVEAGALATAAMVDVQIAAAHDDRSEFDAVLAVARRSRDVARRFHLTVTEATALLFEAMAHSHMGHRSQMEVAIGSALRLAGDEPDIIAGVWEARAFASLLEEKRAQALSEVEMAMTAIRGLPATTPGPYRGLWALLRSMEGLDGPAACTEVRRSGATILPINRAYVAYAEAITLARSGRRREATAAVVRTDAEMAGREYFRYIGLRLVSEIAVKDGWGDPTAWLWQAHTYFVRDGYERLAAACAGLLRQAGATVPRTGRSYSGVPPRFLALGVTRREMEVLKVLVEGLSNREIGERLYLSPRTVEKHVASLLAKTETRTRIQLAALAVSAPPE